MKDIRYNGNLDLKLHNVGFVSVLRNKNYIFEYKTGKERYSLIYVKSGEAQYYYTKTKNKIKIQKGDFLFIPKNIPYKTTYLKDNTILKIIVFDISAKKIPYYLSAPFASNILSIKNVFDSIANDNAYSALYLTAKIYETFFYMQNCSSIIPKKYKKILPALNEIEKNYVQNHNLSFYAALCNMSESNFRKLFKEYTGNSFIEYRNNIRIEAAKKMIESGEFLVSEAAYLAGFNNMSFFYKINKYKNPGARD